MRKYLSLSTLLLTVLACAIPGAAPEVVALPSIDPNAIGTTIAETAAAAQTQTAINLPTSTATPRPTHTPSITPTFTPTFIFRLTTSTPIPTYTLPPTVGVIDTSPGSSGGGEEEEEDGKPDKKDPRTMTGKEWSCSLLGAEPPRDTVYQPETKFNVAWTIFNSGTKEWPRTGVDLVYKGGYRHEETRIQDFTRSVASGGEVKVYASFIAPKRAGTYQTFFTLMVGKRQFCSFMYVFLVPETDKNND